MEYKHILRHNFPENLREIHKPPEKIHYIGKWIEDDEICVTVIGSRHPTIYGQNICKEIINGLKDTGVTIVSGLAIGIDSIAHEQAIINNLKTVAIPGSGIHPDVIYPRRNGILAKNILKSGGCIASQFEIKDRALPWMFPVRNQVMAGLSKLTIVIEAKEKSGSLITAYSAINSNREVGAIPGPVGSELSSGTNSLLKRGAHLITCGDDVLDILGLPRKTDLHKL
jgi:DNA processing protein